VPIREDTDFKTITEKITIKEGEAYLLLPGQCCLGITKENITLSPKYCGLLGRSRFLNAKLMIIITEGRSRFARIGLFVHITAGFMNPGINNRQVLEIYNASNVSLSYLLF
jgi:dCTP deaminase